MNNNRGSDFIADLTSLIVAVIIIVVSLSLPFWAGMTALQLLALQDVGSLTQFNSLFSLNGAVPSFSGTTFTLLLLPIVAFIAAIASAMAVGMRQYSRQISYVNLAAGIVILILLALFLILMASLLSEFLFGTTSPPFSLVLSATGFGFWFIAACSVVLIGQVFVSRNAAVAPANVFAGGGYIQSSPEPVVTRQAAPPVQSAPQANNLVDAWLVNLSTPTRQSIQLTYGDNRIGRSKQRNDIVLEHDTVSREHALIREQKGKFMLITVGAQQPVYLNGQSVQGTAILSHNDRIKLGDVVLEFRC